MTARTHAIRYSSKIRGSINQTWQAAIPAHGEIIISVSWDFNQEGFSDLAPTDIFLNPVSMFLCIVYMLSFVSRSNVWLFGHSSSMKTTSRQNLGPNGFYQFFAAGTAGHPPLLKGSKHDESFICCIKFPWPTTASNVLNVAHFFVFLQNSLNSTLWNPRRLWTPCCLYNFHGVWAVTGNGLPQPHLSGRVWMFFTKL